MRKKTGEKEQDRVWIELERPRNTEHAALIAEKANRMLARLGVTGGREFFWDEHDRCWCFGGDMGYVTLTDNGTWFNLDYMGRP